MADGMGRTGAQRVGFRWRHTMPFTPGLDMWFGDLTTGDLTYSLAVSGDPDGPGVNCGFWDGETPDRLEEIAARMRAALMEASNA